MKITQLETLFVKPRWLFLKVHTDEGIVGLGEPVVEGRSQTVAAAVQEAGRYLIGEDPLRIEHHWQALYRGAFYRGGPVLTSAISGIEQALWDIKGKALGVPVYELLGGRVRDRIRVYGHFGGNSARIYGEKVPPVNSPESYALAAKQRVEDGFRVLKTSLFHAVEAIDTPALVGTVAARMEAIREAVGPEVQVGIDFHGRVGPAMAIRLAKALEPYDPLFIEEPVLPENVDALVRVARSTTVPIATGERLFTKWAFREVLEKQAAFVLQPDLSHAGGILECKKIAAMAEVYYAVIAPHCPLGPISLAAGLQLDACTPNFLCQEQVNLGEGYIKEPFVVKDGYVDIPTKPGLGVELDEEAIAAQLNAGDWETPRLWHEDGAVADW
jgi:galactonate dehydratase